MIKNRLDLGVKFLLLFSICLINSCSNSTKQEIISYDKLIFEAENAIIDSKHRDALSSYIYALNSWKSLYATDINNALLSAVLLKDWEECVFWSEKLIEKGATLLFFNRTVFKELKETPNWQEFEDNYAELKIRYDKIKDAIYIDSLKILMEVDQQEYCLIPSGRVELSDAFDKTKFLDSVLNRLIITKGFPSEELIGANFINDTILAVNPMYYGLLRHSYQSNSKTLVKHLAYAVTEGLIKESLVKSISGVDNFEYIVLDCEIYKNNYLTQDSISSSFMSKKICFNQLDNKLGFILYTPLAVLKGTTKEDLGGKKQFDESYIFISDFADCNVN